MAFDSLLAVFAHPDDESFLCAGTFAALTGSGHRVTLVSATRGEAGEVNHPEIDASEGLAGVREEELRQAMAAVGVSDVRFLPYRDSGMAGTPENDDPASLMQAPLQDVIDEINAVIDDVRPEVVVTFNDDGIYGHPDHVKIHDATRAAVINGRNGDDAFRPAAFYYAVTPREFFVEMAGKPGGPFEGTPPEELAKMGTPSAQITTIIDVDPWAQQKWAAFAAHRSQFGDEGPLADHGPAVMEEVLAREYFVFVPLPWQIGPDHHDPLAEAIDSIGD